MPFKDSARPLAFTMCVGTLCFLAVLESIGIASAPTWALTMLGGYSGEWLIERAVRKGKAHD